MYTFLVHKAIDIDESIVSKKLNSAVKVKYVLTNY